ncbi:MAG: ABC transporter permease [Bacillota bacterium]
MKRKILTAALGIITAMLIGLIIMSVQGYPAFESYYQLFNYSLFSKFSMFSTLAKAAPLILTGLSAAVAFGSNAVNLGQVGQFLVGGMSVTIAGLYINLPPVIMIPLLIFIALFSGALYSGIAAWLRLKFNMDEFITTLMLNFVAQYLTLYLISGPLLDKDMFSPMTQPINENGWLPALGGLDSTIIISTILLIVIYFIWHHTKAGYEWKVMGSNSTFAEAGGADIDKNYLRIMLVSGALAGMAGAMLVMGGVQHRFLKGIGADYGWDGVMIAVVADSSIIGTAFYSLFFAVLQTGAMGMELETSVPSEFVLILQSITVLFVVASRKSAHLLLNRLSILLKMKNIRSGGGVKEDELND